MSQMIESLSNKFAEYSIPADIANNFLAKYRMVKRGIYPEIELSNIPSDDCFKTLQTYCNYTAEAPEELLVHRLLQIPYSQIQETREKLFRIVDAAALEKCYRTSDVYFVKPEFIDELQNFFERKNIEKRDYAGCFINALLLGKSAIARANAIFELFGENSANAKKIISKASIWYPESDTTGLVKYMFACGLTDAQICDLLIEDPILIMHYREEKTLRAGHNQEYVDYAISMAKSTQ